MSSELELCISMATFSLPKHSAQKICGGQVVQVVALIITVIRTRCKCTFTYTLRLTEKIQGTPRETIKR